MPLGGASHVSSPLLLQSMPRSFPEREHHFSLSLWRRDVPMISWLFEGREGGPHAFGRRRICESAPKLFYALVLNAFCTSETKSHSYPELEFHAVGEDGASFGAEAAFSRRKMIFALRKTRFNSRRIYAER